MDELVRDIQSNDANFEFAFMLGAGISVAAGIPDFRSPTIGLYATLSEMRHLRWRDPTFVFNINVFSEDPRPFWWVFSKLWPTGEWPKPTDFHIFMALCFRHGINAHIYTQNVDGLEVDAGIPVANVTYAHGVLDPCRCLKCGHICRLSDLVDQIRPNFTADLSTYDNIIVPLCPNCNDNHVKPCVVFFGEGLPNEFFTNVAEHIPVTTHAIIAGTSLSVAPFSGLPTRLPLDCKVWVMNRDKIREKSGRISQFWKQVTNAVSFGLIDNEGIFDYSDGNHFHIGGDIQDAAKQLIDKLGWTDEYMEIKRNFN